MSKEPTFVEFFESAHPGRGPFPWQERLAASMVNNKWVDWITVPTGLGKTAIIDAWAYALARSAHAHGPQRHVPTRLIFVVNRRGIVDDSFRYAEALANILRTAGAPETPVGWVASQLRQLGFQLQQPLDAVRMRGGVSWDWRWLRQPDQPAVVSSTVDQFGSRLLFRGYGVGDRMKSLDAALVANDSLVVLDEAHISEPLAETAAAVARLQQKCGDYPLAARHMRFVRMTATPPPRVARGESVLTIDEYDRSHLVAGQRIGAEKVLSLIEVTSDKATADSAVATAAAMAARALLHSLPAEVTDPTALVVVNTVAVARGIYDQLCERGDLDTALVIGRCRSFERAAAERTWRERVLAGRTRATTAKPFVLVATQTVEVGADIDADVLVTEACALDALIQRLGRLDRLGSFSEKYGRARAVMLWNRHRHGAADQPACPVYQHASTGVWIALVEQADGPPSLCDPRAKRAEAPLMEAGSVRVGPGALEELIASGVNWSQVLRSPLHAPVLLPTILKGWVSTSPIPEPDRPIEPYLHGPGRGDTEVQLCWRELDRPDALTELDSVPPVTAECVSVSIAAARRFLFGDHLTAKGDEADTLTQTAEDEIVPRSTLRCPIAVRVDGVWERRDLGLGSGTRGVLTPGSMIVVDTSAGGHDHAGWSLPSRWPVVDVADLVERRRPVLRVSERVLRRYGVWDDRVAAAFKALLEAIEVGDQGEGAARTMLHTIATTVAETGAPDHGMHLIYREAFLGRVAAFLDPAAPFTFLRSVVLEASATDPSADGDEVETVPGTATAVLTLSERRLRSGWLSASQVAGADDGVGEASSRTAVAPVRISQHLHGVAARASEMAEKLGLAPPLRSLVVAAANFHDLGKADKRFQTILRSGDWLTCELEDGGDDMLAKSPPGKGLRQQDVPANLRWPRGLRHEGVSTVLLDDTSAWCEGLVAADRDLIRHLVGSHHGFGRPLMPPVLDLAPAAVAVAHDGVEFETKGVQTSIDWSHPQRFAALNERFTPWGLALLESIVRLADIWVSEEGG